MRRTLPTDAETREILSRRRTRPAPRPAPRAGKALQGLIKELDAKFGRGASALEPRWTEIVGDRLARVSYSEPAIDLIPVKDRTAPYSAGDAPQERKP